MVTNSYLYIALPVLSDHMWQLLMIEYLHRNLWWRTLSQSTTQHRTWLDVQYQWLWYKFVNLVLIREAGSVSTSEKIILKLEKICGKEIQKKQQNIVIQLAYYIIQDHGPYIWGVS